MVGFTPFLLGILLPSITVGQDFPSHTLAYQVINGKVFFETTTTPAPSIIETIFPFLGNSYQSVNSPEVDAAILNSISGPPLPEADLEPTPSQNSGVDGLPGLNAYEQLSASPGEINPYQNPSVGFNSYEQSAPGGYNPYKQPAPGGYNPYEQPAPGGYNSNEQPAPAGYNPLELSPPAGFNLSPYENLSSGYNPLQAAPPLHGLNSYQNPPYGSPESPYLSNEEDQDNYLGSASINVPSYLSVPITGIPPPSPSSSPPASPPASPPVNYKGYPSPNYIPFAGPYDPSSIPQYPQQYPLQPQPPQQQYPPQYQQQYPPPNSYFPSTSTQPESSPPFYQPILDFFGFGSRSDPPPAPAPFSYFSQQVVQARNAEVKPNSQDDIEAADAAEASTRSLNPASLASRSDSAPSDDFPCPKLGNWTWDGELCIAVGPIPVWACHPNDLIMSGRIAVCRNKVFL